MAKQDREQTISSVSDILGFILEQSEKPVDKRRPIDSETEKIQAESEYVSTLVDALAMPGTFLGDQTLSTLEDMVNPTFKVKTYRDRIGKAKIKATDLPAFFENPDEFVDKLFQKNKDISKMERLQWAGEQMKMLAGSAYAKNMNLFDDYNPEMKAVMERAVGQSAMASKQETDQNWMIEASHKMVQNGNLSKEINRLKNQISTEQNPAIRKKLEQRLENISGSYKDATTPGDGLTKSFRTLLNKEFEVGQKEILKGRLPKDLSDDELEEYNKVTQASNMVNLWGEYDHTPVKKQQFVRKRMELKEKKKDLLNQKDAIKNGKTFTINGRKVDYSQLSSQERKSQLKNINQMIRGVDSASNSLRSVRFWGGVGKVEGAYYGLKNTLGPGGLEAVLNGDFFDPNKDYWGRPTESSKISLTGKNGAEFEVEFYSTRKSLTDNKLIQGYNEAMTNLYYWNPTTLVKTIRTGERFAWMADKKRKELANMFGIEPGSGVLAGVLEPKFWSFFNKYQKLSPEEQALFLADPKNSQYSLLLGKVLNGLKNKDSKLAKKFLKAQKLAEQFDRLSQWAYVFNTPQRILTAIQDGTIGKLQEKLRNGVVSLLSKMKVFSGSDAAMTLLKSWGLKGGGKALSSAISTAVVNALGIAASSVAPVVGWLVTVAVSFVLEKFAKIAIKIAIFSLAGIIGIIFFSSYLLTSKNQSSTDAYSRETPGSIYYNEAFEGFGGSEGNEGPGDTPRGPGIIPPPSGQECILGSHSIRCTQGWGGGACFSHGSITSIKPVDLAPVGWIEAPQFCDDPGAECVIQSAGPFYCGEVPGGGQVWFSAFDGQTTYKFHFVHTVLGGDYNQGDKVRAGQPFAFVQQSLTWNSCWQGAHLHLETQQNGAYVDPLALLQSFNCNVPDHSGCQNCVGGS